MKNLGYRPDIDGLRAFAVLAVLLFHLDFQLFSGGFVGVDVFFVISGFLITRIIRSEVVREQSFNYLNFYIRRARRILPALLFTLLLSSVLGYVLFAPQHFERLGGAVVHAVFSISNFYFWNESDYFDTASEFKPLLHTWSLGIEEQFYMIWPLVLVLALTRAPRAIAPVLIVLAGLASFVLNLVFAEGPTGLIAQWFPPLTEILPEGHSTIFFLTPFRVFEFAIGALLVWLVDYQPKNSYFLEPLAILGLAMIGYPVVSYSEDIIFPSVNALMPCIGTGLLIYSGTARYAGKLLNNSVAVRIGLISYSLYLIHWPFIVMYKYWKLEELTLIDKFAIVGASTLAAAAMYKGIEQPFRKRSKLKIESNRVFAVICGMFALMLVIPAMSVWQNDGWLWRFHEKLTIQLNFKPNHYDNYVWQRMLRHQGTFQNNGKPKVMVIGDSMAADFVNVLGESNNLEKFDLVTMGTRHGCKPVFPVPDDIYRKHLKEVHELCREEHKAVMDTSLLGEADTVILATLWEDWDIELIDSTVRYLKSRGVRQVAVVGRKDQTVNGIKFNARFAYRRSADRVRTPVASLAQNYNNQISRLKEDFIFIDLLDFFCDDTGCQRVTEEGYLIIYDKTHFSPRGARLVGDEASNSEWMKSLSVKG